MAAASINTGRVCVNPVRLKTSPFKSLYGKENGCRTHVQCRARVHAVQQELVRCTRVFHPQSSTRGVAPFLYIGTDTMVLYYTIIVLWFHTNTRTNVRV